MSWIPDATLALLADAALKATVLLLLAVGTDRVLARSSAAVRHVLWSVTVGALLAVPLLSATVPSFRVPVLPGSLSVGSRPAVALGEAVADVEPAASAAGEPGKRGGGMWTPSAGALLPPAGADGWRASSGPLREEAPGADAGRREGSAGGIRRTASEPGRRAAVAWSEGLGGVWGVGFLLVLLGLLGERAKLARLAGRARRVRQGPIARASRRISRELGLRRTPRLYLTSGKVMPSTWGIFRPRVLLPGTAETWPQDRLDAVLAHELAHVRRRDCAVQTAAALACALYWYHPLAWLAASRLRRERELAADDEAVALNGRRSGYAGELLSLARESRPLTPALTATTLARPAGLSRRLEALVEEGRSRRRLGWRVALAASAMAAAVAVPLSAVEPFEAGAASARGMAPDRSRELGALESELTESEGAQGEGALPDSSAGAPAFRLTASECWKPDVPHSMDIHVDDAGHDLTWRSARCRGEMRVRGEITFTDDFSWIRSISAGGLVRLWEETGGLRRLAEFRPGGDRQVVLTFRENGESRDPDSGDRRWIEGRILTLLRQTGLGAERRVAWLMEQGGPGTVLEEVDRMVADRAQALYLTELLSQTRLDEDRLRRTLEATAHVGSDGRQAEVLAAAAGRYPEAVAGPLAPSFMDAASGVGSDSRHAWMLEEALQRGGPGLLGLALRSARASVGSDSQMARFLEVVADRHPAALTGESREEFVQALDTVGSDTQQARTLIMILRRRPGDEATVALALASARSGVGSDAEMARFLVEVAREHHELVGTGTLGTAFDAALQTVGSDSEETRVRRALHRATSRSR